MSPSYQTTHAAFEWYLLHKDSESSGDSGNIKNVPIDKSITNTFW